MVTIQKGKIIIEIQDNSPVERLTEFQNAIIEMASRQTEHSTNATSVILDLLSELLPTSSQLMTGFQVA